MGEVVWQNEPAINIPIDQFVSRFNVENPQVVEVLHKFPTLCYLLGNVTDQPQTTDARPDNVQRPVFFQTEGSSMFGLKNPEDAMRWKGIFNHIAGSIRNIQFISQKLANATEEQKQKFASLGFDKSSIDTVDPQLLVDFMFISHAGRRIADEHAWHGIHNAPQDPRSVNPTDHSYLYTMELLKEFGADQKLLYLMKVEDHEYEVEAGKDGINRDIADNILTYCDWTFNQKPTTLTERFQGLRQSGRQSKEVLDVLETAGTNFENALKEVFGQGIYEQMANADPFPGEKEVREAYAASAGLTLAEVYPDFATQYAA